MAVRVDPIEALRGANRATARTGSFSRKTLVALQAALSLVLLSAAGLLTAALQRLENQNFGFEQDRRMVAIVNPKLAGYQAGQLSQLYQRIHDSIAGIPGVSSVALCLYSPQSGGGWGSAVFVDGHPAPGPMDDYFAGWNRVTAGYFGVIGTPVVKGRGTSEQDTAVSRHVAVIDEAFARKFFRNEDPIGKHFGRTAEASREYEVVGVAKDARYLPFNLDRPSPAFFFLPEPQAEYTHTNLGSLFLHDIVILTRPGASLSLAELRRAMASVDPNLPVVSLRTLREQVAGQFTQPRLIARLTSFFGILSLVLASIGLYGVTAYNAGRRVNEIGVRIALGASRGDVIRLVLRGAFGLVLIGLFIGLPLTFAVGRFLGSQLYGMNPYNPVVTLTAAVALALAALAASLVPAWRASAISPLDALRAL
jgi:predicted permease